jgi:hypothetical protein
VPVRSPAYTREERRPDGTFALDALQQPLVVEREATVVVE